MPDAVIKSLLAGSSLGEKVYLLNLTPYEGWVEKACVQFRSKNPGHQLHSLTASTDVATTSYCEKMVAFFLMEDIYCLLCFRITFETTLKSVLLKEHNHMWGHMFVTGLES